MRPSAVVVTADGFHMSRGPVPKGATTLQAPSDARRSSPFAEKSATRSLPSDSWCTSFGAPKDDATGGAEDSADVGVQVSVAATAPSCVRTEPRPTAITAIAAGTTATTVRSPCARRARCAARPTVVPLVVGDRHPVGERTDRRGT
ncbi:hypothetical protein DEJ23_09375 [Curtobacterium sp. MCSS17_008]|nr:hypothetical protein DEJ23_09375 [Curtobacterium sp. MCSS17_008]